MAGTDNNPELESRFIKLAYSSLLKTVQEIAPEVDVAQTVRQHMLTICDGVRARALEAATDEVSPANATAPVDALITTINDYFDYADSPMFPTVELVSRTKS
jgi:hypothetical protein